MKLLRILFIGLFSMVLLTACNLDGDPEDETRMGDDTLENLVEETKEDEEEFEITEAEVPFIFTDFELDVNIDNDKDIEFEVEFQREDNMIKAEYEDEVAGVKLKGEAAYEKIKPLLEALKIDENTTEEDTIQEVIDVFEIPENFEDLELKIEFSDGVIRKYERR